MKVSILWLLPVLSFVTSCDFHKRLDGAEAAGGGWFVKGSEFLRVEACEHCEFFELVVMIVSVNVECIGKEVGCFRAEFPRFGGVESCSAVLHGEAFDFVLGEGVPSGGCCDEFFHGDTPNLL